MASKPVPPDRPKPVVPPQPPAGFQEALRLTQESLLALQRMNEQTAELHRQFLEGQDRALEVFHSLLQQQQALLLGQTPASAALVQTSPPLPPSPTRGEGDKKEPSPTSGEGECRLAARLAERGLTPPIRNGHAPQEISHSPAKREAASAFKSTLLAVVSEKTGYPVEMLELGMELDTDLGIDSIKRVEIFSALQERLPDTPALPAEQLGSLRTLRDILGHLTGAMEPTSSPEEESNAMLGGTSPATEQVLLAVVSEKTGYPVEMLELGMELDADLGIDSIKRVEIFSALQERLPGAPALPAEQLGTLRTVHDVLECLRPGTVISSSGKLTGANGRSPSPDARAVLEVVADKLGLLLDELELGLELGVSVAIQPEKWADIRATLVQRFPQAALPEAPPPLPELVQSLFALPAMSLSNGERSNDAACGLAPTSTSFLHVDKEPPDGTHLSLAFDRLVSVETCPVLEAHILDGRAVLPVALMAEWLAQGALHGNPDLILHGLEDLRVCQGVKLEGTSSLRLQVRAGKRLRSDGYRVPVELSSDSQGRRLRHAIAVAVLVTRLPEAEAAFSAVPLAPYWREVGEVYEQVLFHGPALQGLTLIEGCSEAGISARVRTAPPPATWLRQPLRSNWLIDPLVLDACLQLLSLWSYEQTGAAALPTQVGRLRLFTRTFPPGEMQLAAHITQHRPPTLRADIGITDSAGQLLARLGDCVCVSDPSLNAAFRRNRLTAPTC